MGRRQFQGILAFAIVIAIACSPPLPTTPTAPLPLPAAMVDPVEISRTPLPGLSKMPLPGQCAAMYTDEARAAATEGVVVLDLIVDEHGHARDITLVEGLPHGLTEAAIAALHTCTFTPGERNGQPVPVRIRGFKFRFLM